MRGLIIKKIFTYRQRLCVVVEINSKVLSEGFTGLPIDESYHNGYATVQQSSRVLTQNDLCRMIVTDEITFFGKLSHIENPKIPKDEVFVGFDTAHAWNDQKPESKTFKAVFEKTKKLVDEMIKRRI